MAAAGMVNEEFLLPFAGAARLRSGRPTLITIEKLAKYACTRTTST
jgi:hypothetical protein